MIFWEKAYLKKGKNSNPYLLNFKLFQSLQNKEIRISLPIKAALSLSLFIQKKEKVEKKLVTT